MTQNLTLTTVLVLSVAASLVGCGNDTSTSESASGSAGSTTEMPLTTGTPTTTAPTTMTGASATEGTGTATEGMTTTPNPTTSTSGPTTGETGTTGGETTGSITTGVETTGSTSSTSGVESTGTTSEGTTMGVDPGSTSGTTGEPPPCMPGNGMGMGMIDKSYIWVPSHTLGDVAKVNTLTLIEEGRYRTGPNGAGENPSRTAVSADGRFVVVNARNTGRSTMIAANKEDCIDKNGNGVIETSTGPNDVKAWGADECVRWTIVHPVGAGTPAGPRGITWTPGTWSVDECKFVDPKVWLGYRTGPSNEAHIVRLDGVTGTLEQTIVVPGWSGSGYAPYGGALDPQFRPWFTGLRGEAIRVNTDQNPITLSRYTPPGNIQAYGMTVDSEGNPWIGGCSGPVSTFDVQTNQWIAIAGTSACHRGIGAGDKYVWIASNSPCGLVQVDRKSRTLVAKHTPPQCSTAIGISIDIEGFLWLVDQAGWAWKIDQDNVAWDKKVTINGGHYVYSDMTGGQVNSILPQ